MRPLVPAVALTIALTACTASTPDEEGSRRVVVPVLDEAWRAPLPRAGVWHDLDDSRGDGLWPGRDAVSAVADGAVTTYDVATGEVRSTVPLGGPVCAASRDLNADGVGVLMLGPIEDCRTLVAVDTNVGEVRWRRELEASPFLNDVSVGDRAVAVTDARRGARRFRIDDGSLLPALGGTGEAASDGSVVVVTPEGGGARESYDVYDQDSGDLLRSLPAEANVGVEVVVSNDPLVVTAYSHRDDGTFLRDLSGDRPTRFGRQTNAGFPHLTEHLLAGDSVAVQYGASPVVELWAARPPVTAVPTVLDPDERIVGTINGRLVTLTPAADEVVGDTSVVRLVDPADPADPQVLGTAPADRPACCSAPRPPRWWAGCW